MLHAVGIEVALFGQVGDPPAIAAGFLVCGG